MGPQWWIWRSSVDPSHLWNDDETPSSCADRHRPIHCLPYRTALLFFYPLLRNVEIYQSLKGPVGPYFEFMPSVKDGLTKSPMGLNFKGPVKFFPTKLIAIFNSVSIALFWKHPQSSSSSSSSSSCYFTEWTRSSPILQWPLLNSLSLFPLKPQSTGRLQFWNHLRLSLTLHSSSPRLPNLETFQSFPGSPESDAKLITLVLYQHRPNRKNLRPVQLRRPSLISSMCFCQSPIATLISPKEQDW